MKTPAIIVAVFDADDVPDISTLDESGHGERIIDSLIRMAERSKKERIADIVSIRNAVVVTSEKMMDEFVREVLPKRIAFYGGYV